MAKGYYGQFPISEGFKSELGLSKQFPYEGFSTKYQGPDKTGFIDYAKKGFKSIFGKVPNTGIGGGTVGQRIIYENMLKYLGNAGKFAGAINKLPVLGAASDVLFGTRNTMNTVDSINNLLGFSGTQDMARDRREQREAEQAAAKAAAAKAAALAGGAAGASTPTYQDTAQDRQEQRERERGGANRSFTRTEYGKAYKKGGIVGLNYLTRRL